MVDIVYVYKSLKISIETVMKNSGKLKFVSNCLKSKKMCKNALKNLPYILRYVPD